ncbi:Transcriptional activator protein UGA3 [Sphaceloma murrayae]|uniref:Transcriptional activator protein UGA3 n=1 Tax=Sphaceloma murrayae TaxID=2082308 RepID=A0A2K1QUQ9_9PEZI|nr:Transcriptional activator protein UGA3 [Sphaceloma murrayae]
MTVPDGNVEPSLRDPPASASKPKRVRTGCLTCRERHLKCDEGQPNCQNCKKSNRVCKRGLRLNFIDIQTHAPPRIALSNEYDISFLDESRDIASEYRGGLEKYGAGQSVAQQQHQHHQQRQQQHIASQAHNGLHLEQQQQQQQQRHPQIDPSLTQYDQHSSAPPAPSMSYQELPPIQGILPDSGYSEDPHAMTNQIKFDAPKYDQPHDQHSYNRHSSTTQSPFSNQHPIHSSNSNYTQHTSQPADNDPAGEKRDYLENPEEVLFLQVFVEEVGLWMDSMDPSKHFSRLLPFHSLQEPMLLNAFLACGARHLTLINPIYTEEKALYYYDTATRHLLKALQNPNRDTVICATTAVILNVYEIMSERALQRMNHIAGARALIKECGWNARATGIGSACFWLNVGLEVLSCLHFNWQVAWDPDDWGVDMDFARELHNGREEVWTHRMLYIVAKVCNFRATIPRFQEADPRDEEMRRQNRYSEWQRLKGWADAWNESIPRTMHPMAYVHPHQTTNKSAFPEIWLIKRSTIVARLFFHTVMLLLAQIHPYMPADNPDMWNMQKQHSQMICGIAAHVKDRGVASVALRSLAHAAECLTDRREQEEVLQIFTKINKETGWRIAFVFKELKERWAWKDDPMPNVHITSNADPKVRAVGHNPSTASYSGSSPQSYPQTGMQSQTQNQSYGSTSSHGFGQASAQQSTAPSSGSTSIAAPTPRRPPSGIVNPMFATADFSMPQHPYQNVYVAPNHAGQNQTQWGFASGGQGVGVGGAFY